ncbi:hypothetical protein [Pseudomonas sp. NPDC090201]|uniref:hypothetical protein n=1 Tax=Pseudomonas sp. NPDC090201 TaxID=3364475 RepID=UPI0037F16FA7
MKPINEADWLSRLNINITSNSNRIFNNGNNQLQVSVGLTPRKGESITKEQLNSVRLVTLDDDGQYRELSGEYRVSRKRDERFEYYADTGMAPSRLLESTACSRKFYVSSTASGGSIKTLYAAVTRDEDSHYVSHTSVFNSSVKVETITSPNRQRSDFKLERVDALMDTVTDVVEHDRKSWKVKTAVDIDLYHLEFKNPAFRIVDADAAFQDGLAATFLGERDDGEVFWGNNFASPSVEMNLHYLVDPLSQVQAFGYRHLSVPINTRAGAMNFIRLQLRGIDPKPEAGPPAPGSFAVLDQYGNKYKIKMTIEGAGNFMDFRMLR